HPSTPPEAANLLCEFPPLPPDFLPVPAISWKGGFTNFMNRYLRSVGRKDSYRYLLAGHALGLATNIWSISKGTLVSISIDSAGTTATVTTKSDHKLKGGERVRVSGAIAPPPSVFDKNFTLNG